MSYIHGIGLIFQEKAKLGFKFFHWTRENLENLTSNLSPALESIFREIKPTKEKSFFETGISNYEKLVKFDEKNVKKS